MKNIGKIILDLFVFLLIIILSKLIIVLFREVFHVQRDTGNIIATIFIIISTVTYSYIKNKPHLLSIGYGIVVSFILLIIVDSNDASMFGIVFLIIAFIGFIYYAIQQNKHENSTTSKFDKLEISEFSKGGDLEGNFNYENFIVKRELNINKSAYKNYKPLLINKYIDENNELLLDYSNKDDLSFTVLINKKNEMYIKYKMEVKNVDFINRYILESIQAYANN